MKVLAQVPWPKFTFQKQVKKKVYIFRSYVSVCTSQGSHSKQCNLRLHLGGTTDVMPHSFKAALTSSTECNSGKIQKLSIWS